MDAHCLFLINFTTPLSPNNVRNFAVCSRMNMVGKKKRLHNHSSTKGHQHTSGRRRRVERQEHEDIGEEESVCVVVGDEEKERGVRGGPGEEEVWKSWDVQIVKMMLLLLSLLSIQPPSSSPPSSSSSSSPSSLLPFSLPLLPFSLSLSPSFSLLGISFILFYSLSLCIHWVSFGGRALFFV